MTALLPAPTPVPANRRPQRRSLGLVAAVTVLGLVWSGLILLWPASVDVTTGRATFAGTADVAEVPGYGPRGTSVVDYRHGAAVEITVPLRNRGPLPVTVVSAAPVAGLLPLLEVRAVDGLPLELGPGEQGALRLQAALGNCRYYHEREVQNVHALRLDVGVPVPLAPPTTVVVPLDRPLLVHSPMIVGCPDRKLDRQADDRTDAL